MESNMSGTTVASLILTTKKMISLNLGDSCAALFRHDTGLYYCKIQEDKRGKRKSRDISNFLFFN